MRRGNIPRITNISQGKLAKYRVVSDVKDGSLRHAPSQKDGV